jgi:hypothetical protein
VNTTLKQAPFAVARQESPYAADCTLHQGACPITKDLFVILEEGDEAAAIAALVNKCGTVAIVPNPFDFGTVLYRTGCSRMLDMIEQTFKHHIADAVEKEVPPLQQEQSIGTFYRMELKLTPYDVQHQLDMAFR